MSEPLRRSAGNLREVFAAFLKLGCISFGGPVAHISYLRDEFVSKRRWLDDAAYSDLVALCQFLPGPASSQVVFALGAQRAGWLGGLLASLCFTLPSAALMILFGYGVSALGDLQHAGWLHGLKLASVAVVAQAVWGDGAESLSGSDQANHRHFRGSAAVVCLKRAGSNWRHFYRRRHRLVALSQGDSTLRNCWAGGLETPSGCRRRAQHVLFAAFLPAGSCIRHRK
jgi:chromate transport protein ChrA